VDEGPPTIRRGGSPACSSSPLSTPWFNSSLKPHLQEVGTDIRLSIQPLCGLRGYSTPSTRCHALKTYLQFNPIAHLIEWLRTGCFPGFESNSYNPWYPLSFGLVLLFIGGAIDWYVRSTGRE